MTMSTNSRVIVESIETRVLNENSVYTKGIIANVISKNTSSLLSSLNELLPLLHYGLGHLKRARKCPNNITEILICSSCYKDDIPESIRELCISMHEIDVAKLPPETNEEYIAWGHNWPINFRPTAIVREMSQGLSSDSIQHHLHFMSMANLDGQHFHHHSIHSNQAQHNSSHNDNLKISSGEHHLYNKKGAILVNPLTQQVVMTSYDAYVYLCNKHCVDDANDLLNHPLYTPTMMCIEGVAALVRGECVMHHALVPSVAAINNACTNDDSLDKTNISNTQTTSSIHYQDSDDSASTQCDSNIIIFPSSSLSSSSLNTAILTPTKKLTTDHNYLCCGLDLYVACEPDVMSCMALVHSRIHSVYFENVDSQYGGLGSKMYIHSLRSLNHHYRAFRIVQA